MDFSLILGGAAKTLAWYGAHLVLGAARIAAHISGRTRRVSVIVYKVDRLGDWLLAAPSIARIVAATQRSGSTVTVWAGRESDGLRKWRPLDCPVSTVEFEPRGWMARGRRTWAIIRLLAIYRADTFFCLRHSPDPIRDFVLKAVAAKNIYALSWRIFPGEPKAVPHEVRRHYWILAAAGLAPRDVKELLPRLNRVATVPDSPIVIAPFSSALIKDWPDTSWSAVVSGFSDRARKWELWVGSDQLARAEALAARLRKHQPAGLQVTVRSGSLADLADAIASAPLVVTVDTLAAHLAAAANASMVCILGGGQYGDFAPWSHSGRQRWVSHPLPCYNCGWHCTRQQNDCLQLIAPATVVAAMKALWDSDSSRTPETAAHSRPKELPAPKRA